VEAFGLAQMNLKTNVKLKAYIFGFSVIIVSNNFHNVIKLSRGKVQKDFDMTGKD